MKSGGKVDPWLFLTMKQEEKEALKELDEISKQKSRYIATTPLLPGENPPGKTSEELKEYKSLVERERQLLNQLRRLRAS